MLRILVFQIVLALGSLHDTLATFSLSDGCNGIGEIAKPTKPCTKASVLFVCVTPNLGFQDINTENFQTSACSSSPEIIILFPGFTEGVNSEWINKSAGLLAQKKNINVLIVNYLVCAPDYQYYFYGVLNINIPAEATVDIITVLKAKVNLCYGHSFGGQLCGRLGQLLPITVILASDPAGPCFEGAELSKRLDAGDANFVIIVHTNIGLMGSKDTGNADYYPNGGMVQPGCEAVTTNIQDIVGNPTSLGFDKVFCSHRRGYELVLESIKEAYIMCAKQVDLPLPTVIISNIYKNDCNTSTEAKCNALGTKARKPSTNTQYYLATNSKPPFTINKCPS